MILRVSRSGEGDVHEYTFRRRQALVGSGPRADLCLQLPAVAPRHALLINDDGRVWLEPIRPDQSLTVESEDGRARTATGRCELRPGDRLLLGNDVEFARIELVTNGAADASSVVRSQVLFHLRDLPRSVEPAAALARAAQQAASAEQLRGQIGRFAETLPWAREAGLVLARLATLQPTDLDRLDAQFPSPLGSSCRRQLFRHLKDGAVAAVGSPGAVALIPVRHSDVLVGAIWLAHDTPVDVESLRQAAAPAARAVGAAIHRLAREAELSVLRDEVAYFRERERRHYLYKDLITKSESMATVYDRVRAVRDRAHPVLIVGEKGTGKEMIARALHHLSERSDGLMISLRCQTQDPERLDRELCGLGQGKGLLELTQGGTLFLEEIDCLPLRLQTKLARAVIEREVRPEGAPVGRPVDVRIVASTELDLFPLVADGRFRKDLYHQLDACRLRIPPLRERLADILPLADVFAAQLGLQYRKAITRVDPALGERLAAYSWPGNVRELQGAIEAAVIQAPADAEAIVEIPWLR